MTFPRYPEYMDSGVEWVGQVPIHWGVERLKVSVKTCRNGIWGTEANGSEDDIPCVRVADFDRTKLEVNHEVPTIRNVTEKEQLNRTLSKGNLLIEKSGGGENQPVGCVVLYNSTHKAVCSNFVAKIELASNMDPSFWRYVHSAAYSIRLTIGSINQTSGIQNLDQDRYFNERSAYPPLNEQTVIAKFLEIETAKIDSLVAEQAKLIELLKEKRQTVISHAVTNGLDSKVKMKDSGVEWLGRVPESWDVIRLKKITTRISSGKTPSGGADVYVDCGVIFLRSQNVYDEGLRLEDVVRIPEKIDAEMSSSRVKGGDILLNITGGSIGRSCCLPYDFESANVNQHVCAIRLSDPDMVSFVELFFKSDIIKKQIDYIQNGAAREGLNFEQIGNFSICIPPPDERKLLVEGVRRKIKNFNDLTSQIIESITLLQERRSALISAAVCGQIDVRTTNGN